MKKYFLAKQEQNALIQISQKEIDAYRNRLIDALLRLGATDNDMSLICDTIVKNSILNHRNPEDVAWAVLQ